MIVKEQEVVVESVENSQKAEKKQRDFSIDLMRIIACLIVISTHVCLQVLNPCYNRIDWSRLLEKCFLVDGVSIFFMITGFFIANGRSYKKIWKSTILKILLPSFIYVLFSQIFYMFIINQESIIWCLKNAFSNINLIGIGKGIITGNANELSPLCQHLWYIFSYTKIIIFIPVLWLICKEDKVPKIIRRVLIALGIFGTIISDVGRFIALPEILNFDIFKIIGREFIYVLIGYELFVNKDKIKNHKKLIFILSSITFVLINFIRYKLEVKYMVMNSFTNIGGREGFAEWKDTFISIISALSIFMAIYSFDIKSVKLQSIITWFADKTFGIYLIHYLFIAKVDLYKFEKIEKFCQEIIYLVLATIITFAISTLIVTIIKSRKKIVQAIIEDDEQNESGDLVKVKFVKLTKILDIVILIAFIILASYWAFSNKMNTAPDEEMRYSLSKYIYNHNKLPLPRDPEVLASPYNASYAYYPLLIGAITSAGFMKISSFLGFNDANQLLIAARLTSVLSGAIAVFFLIKITRKLFKNDPYTKYFTIIMASFIPQFVYLSSYVNNDIIAVAASTIMVYAWIVAMEDGWNIKRLVLLSVGIILCALSYFDAYAWILMSIFIFITTFIYKESEDNEKSNLKLDYKAMIKNGIIVSIIVLVGISYFFIRNYIINDGDMLGMKSFLADCEEGGIESQKPSNREIGKNLGMTYLETITSTRWYGESWIWITFRSFICILGGMSIHLPNYNYYYFYAGLFAVGLISMLFTAIFKDRKNIKKKILYLSMFLALIITIFLSIQYSYATDYQPQGRYIYPIWLPLMLFTAIGIQSIFNLLSKLVKNKKIVEILKMITYIILCCVFINVICIANTLLSQFAF